MDSNRQSIGAAMTAKHDSITAAMRGEADEAPRIEAAEAEAAASILLRAYGEWKDHKFPLCHESRSDYEKVLMRAGPALARYVLATRPRPGTAVREEVVSELSRAIHLIDHEDQAGTREARDLLIRLKALLSAPADGVVCKNPMPSGRRACDALPLDGCPCNDPARNAGEVGRG